MITIACMIFLVIALGYCCIIYFIFTHIFNLYLTIYTLYLKNHTQIYKTIALYVNDRREDEINQTN